MSCVWRFGLVRCVTSGIASPVVWHAWRLRYVRLPSMRSKPPFDLAYVWPSLALCFVTRRHPWFICVIMMK